MKIDVEADKLEEFLENLPNAIKEASEKSLDDIATYTLRQMRLGYMEADFQPSETMNFVKQKNGNEIIVSMVGPQAWYSEFGTGTKGRLRPHPLKDKYNLNPYNSGPTIRRATEKVARKEKAIREGITKGTLYWTYKASNGEIYYTRGISAQKEVYTAGKLAKKKLPEILDRNMEKVLRKK